MNPRYKEIIDNCKFCKDCGEYIDSDGDCSNPFCPEEMEGDELVDPRFITNDRGVYEYPHYNKCKCEHCLKVRQVKDTNVV